MGKKDTFNVGDFVFAKVKGYRPWPAKILTAVSKKHSVYFYGTKEVGKNIKPTDLWPYRDNKERYSKGGALKQQFEDAINQIEEAIKGNDSCPSPTVVFQNLNASTMKQEATLNESQIEEDNVNDVTAEVQSEVPVEDPEPQTMDTEETVEEVTEPEPAPVPVIKPIKKETKRAAQVKKEPLKEKEKVQKVVNDATMETEPEDKSKADDKSTNELDQENDKNLMTRGTRKGKAEKRTIKTELTDEIPAKKANVKKDKSSTIIEASAENPDGKEDEAEAKKRALLVLECKLCVIFQDIKVSLSLDKPDPPKCIELLETVKTIMPDVTLIMIYKNPTIVETMRRLKRYVGNTVNWKLPRKELAVFHANATKIRELSAEIYEMFKDKFKADGVQTFWEMFAELLTKFQERTKALDEDALADLCYEEQLP